MPNCIPKNKTSSKDDQRRYWHFTCRKACWNDTMFVSSWNNFIVQPFQPFEPPCS